MSLDDILKALAKIPVEILPEPTEEEQKKDEAEPTITLVMYEKEETHEFSCTYPNSHPTDC